MKMVYFHKNDGRAMTIGEAAMTIGEATMPRDAIALTVNVPRIPIPPYVHNMMVWQIMTLGTPSD